MVDFFDDFLFSRQKFDRLSPHYPPALPPHRIELFNRTFKPPRMGAEN